MNRFNVKIEPSRLVGKVIAPPSKSISHRALICAALAEGESVISNLAFSQDILATIDVLTAIGAKIDKIDDSTLKVMGIAGKPRSLDVLGCRESGSTLRFMIPICLLSTDEFKLSGSEKLLSRPLSVYENLFAERYLGSDGKALTLASGKPIEPGEYRVAGNISSQFITGLLFALPLCDGDSKLIVEGDFESASYVGLTLASLSKFGINITREGNIFTVKGNQKYIPSKARIEGDASNAAFFGALGLIGGEVEVIGLDPESKQGDMVFNKHFSALKAHSDLPIDLSDCPDLAPILFSAAAFFGGGIFTHTDRLRLKESDRISAMAEELAKFGAVLDITDGLDGGTVKVLRSNLHPPSSPLDSHNDHRIAMSMAILCCRFGGEIIGAEAVRKSMPDFFDVLASLGAKIQTETTK
ncbi:MAG: 3-phosphoshikimate 1-carboxyvinyltransferase [Clostridia bacterium]|nr:3-phosphoshikimate 1-carboxyvinyltransferase [Clostridia bacterium]